MIRSEFNYHRENSILIPCFLTPCNEIISSKHVGIYCGDQLIMSFVAKQSDEDLAKAMELINNPVFIRILGFFSYSGLFCCKIINGADLLWPKACCGLKQRDLITLDLQYRPGELVTFFHIKESEGLAIFLALTTETSNIIYPEGRFYTHLHVPVSHSPLPLS